MNSNYDASMRSIHECIQNDFKEREYYTGEQLWIDLENQKSWTEQRGEVKGRENTNQPASPCLSFQPARTHIFQWATRLDACSHSHIITGALISALSSKFSLPVSLSSPPDSDSHIHEAYCCFQVRPSQEQFCWFTGFATSLEVYMPPLRDH